MKSKHIHGPASPDYDLWLREISSRFSRISESFALGMSRKYLGNVHLVHHLYFK